MARKTRKRGLLRRILGVGVITAALVGSGMVLSAASATHPKVVLELKCDPATGLYNGTTTVYGDAGYPSAIGTIKSQTLATTNQDGTGGPNSLVNKTVQGNGSVVGYHTGLQPNTTYTQKVSVQWSNGGHKSEDDDTFKTGGDCTPPDACPEIPGDQPPGTNCTQPSQERETRDLPGVVDCTADTYTVEHQERTRDYFWDGDSWEPGPWSAWTTYDTTVVEATGEQCPSVATAPTSGDRCEPRKGGTNDWYRIPNDEHFTYLWNGGVIAPGTYRAPHKRYVFTATPKPGEVAAEGSQTRWVVKFTKKQCFEPKAVRAAVKSVDKCRTSGDLFAVRKGPGVIYYADGQRIREGVWLKTHGDRKIVVKAKAASKKFKVVGKDRWVLRFDNRPCGTPDVPPDTGHRSHLP